MTIILSLIILAVTAPVQARPYEGKIKSIRAGVIKITEARSNETFNLVFGDPIIKESVANLKRNDFINFEGVKNLTHSYLRIDSINYVGLTDLKATWTGDDGYCYMFSSFTDLSIYPKDKTCSKKIRGPREFAYTINASDDHWFMLVSDAQSRYTADLKFITLDHAELTLYDVDNGNILRLIQLTK